MACPDVEAVCNVCGATEFAAFAGRADALCAGCSATERTRTLKLMLDHFGLVVPGIRVLHFAPEFGIAKFIRGIVGEGYEPYDLKPDRYWYAQIGVRRFDLVNDLHTLQSNSYDLVIHSHVLEHLPCNETAVLWHLHRALKPSGAHLFSVPIMPGCYASDLGDIGDSARKARFGLEDHVRSFGRDDLDRTLGMVFDLPTVDLVELFGAQLLRRHNIPLSRRASAQTFWLLRKHHLKLWN